MRYNIKHDFTTSATMRIISRQHMFKTTTYQTLAGKTINQFSIQIINMHPHRFYIHGFYLTKMLMLIRRLISGYFQKLFNQGKSKHEIVVLDNKFKQLLLHIFI